MIKNNDVTVKFKGGGSFISLPPVFSCNGQYTLVAWKNVVFCYNTKTGKRFLEYKGLEEDVIGFGIYSLDEIEYLCACTVSGNGAIWKLDSALKLKKFSIPIKEPLTTFKVICRNTANQKSLYKAVISWKIGHSLKFGMLDLESVDFTTFEISLKAKNRYALDIGGSGRNLSLCVVQGKNMFYIKLKRMEIVHKRVLNKRKFTCVASHPENDSVLTGDNTGRTILWQNLTSAKHTQAVFHWHTLPVQTVSFSTSGSSFYSGGGECVLVKWDFDNPHQKKFLPRLPSDIRQIAVANDNKYIAVATADNAIHVVDSRFALVSHIQHLVLGENFPAGIVYDPRTKCLIMNGMVGHLQFYSPRDMQLLYNLDVVGMNKLTKERDSEIANTEVTKMDINRSGLWLATIEERDDSDLTSYEIRLKFWSFNATQQTYELNTSIEYPHEQKVTALKFQPTAKDIDLRCITLSNDKTFKIWQLVNVTTVYSDGYSWRCAGTAFYRDFIPKVLAFSYDGSLSAIGFENILTTWLPNSCELKCSLLHPKYRENIAHVAFGVGNECHLLVSASRRRVSVWNLLSLSMVWTVQIKVTNFVADISSPHMAVFSDKQVVVFEPSSPNPIYSNADLVETKKFIIASTFIPNTNVSKHTNNWYQKSQLLYINSNQELYSLESNEESIEPVQFIYEESNTLFSQMAPALKSSAVHSKEPVTHAYTKAVMVKKLNEFLDTPVHTMAPISVVCYSILSSMIYEERCSEVNSEDEHVESMEVEFGNKEVVYSNVEEDLETVSKEPTAWIQAVFS